MRRGRGGVGAGASRTCSDLGLPQPVAKLKDVVERIPRDGVRMRSRRVPSTAHSLGLMVALLAVALVTTLTACVPPTPPQIGGWFGTGQGVEPTRVQFSVDNSENASSARWFQYDQKQAAAYATINLNDCTPFCYNGHWHHRPVRLHFYNNKGGRFTIGEVFYLNGTRNLAGHSNERWNVG
jgi:hypothetical protein